PRAVATSPRRGDRAHSFVSTVLWRARAPATPRSPVGAAPLPRRGGQASAARGDSRRRRAGGWCLGRRVGCALVRSPRSPPEDLASTRRNNRAILVHLRLSGCRSGG